MHRACCGLSTLTTLNPRGLDTGMEITYNDSDALLEHASIEDGCPRAVGQKVDEHFTPDPHADLPVYTTIHQ